MSSLWTPDGERPIPSTPEQEDDDDLAAAQYLAELQNTPAAPIIGNHAIQLFELARVYLTAQPARLDDAQLTIDAMAAIVEGVGGRLGEDEDVLKDGLAQMRMAFVQIKGALTATAVAAAAGDEPED